MSIEFIVNPFMGIAAAFFTCLIFISYYFTPKKCDVIECKDKMIIKLITKMAQLEIDFYFKLSDLFAPPDPQIAGKSQIGAIHIDTPEFAKNYVEDCEILFRNRERIYRIERSFDRYDKLKILNLIIYLIALMVVNYLQYREYSHLLLYTAILIYPFVLFIPICFKLHHLLKAINEQ